MPKGTWPVILAALAVTSAMVGIHWDISWHRSIGRDTFWTPPHMAIYLCGVLAGAASGYAILRATLVKSEAEGTVRVLGFRGPLGAFILAWGGIAMLTSAPFDDWWHNAYGLDVKIISPPHALLALGMLSVQAGALVLVRGYLSRSEGVLRRRLTALYLYIGGMMVVAVMTFLMERTDRTDMHTAEFYLDVAVALPWVFVGVSRGAQARWAATAIAGVFTVFQLLLLWILPLFPAVPKLSPVYFPVTHFVPPPFPLLLIVPALAIDLLRQQPTLAARGKLTAALTGVAFLGAFAAVQWPFANFLLAPASRNWLFGTHYLGFDNRPWWTNAQNVFTPTEAGSLFWRNAALALVAATVSAVLGHGLGTWLERVRR
jgi:hypothetical protein